MSYSQNLVAEMKYNDIDPLDQRSGMEPGVSHVNFVQYASSLKRGEMGLILIVQDWSFF